MIPPILGESFAKSASLDNGRNGLASIGGANINTSSDLIDTGMKLANSLQLSPMLAKQAVNDMFEAGAGKKVYAVEEPIARDKNGNIIGGGVRYTTDANAGGTEVIGARSGGLYGNYAQGQANDIEQEERQYKLNQNKIKNAEKERQTIEMYQKNVKATLGAIKDSANTKANNEMKAFFGENAGSFDDIKKTMDNYFMNTIGGYDLKEAVNSYDNGASNSAIYTAMHNKGLSDAQISQIMSMARQVNNTDVEKKNTEAGILTREDTMRLANDVKTRLGQQGYNNAESTYLAKLGVSLGSKGIENESVALEAAHNANRLKTSKLSLQAIELENKMKEAKRHNLAMEAIERDRNKLLASRQTDGDNNKTMTPEEAEKLHIVDWQKGSAFGYGDDKVYFEDSNGDKYIADKGMFTLEDDGKTLKKIDGYKGNGEIIKLNSNRLSVNDEDKMIKNAQTEMLKYEQIMEQNPTTSNQYKDAEKKWNDILNNVYKYVGANENQNIYSAIANRTSNDFEDLSYAAGAVLTSFNDVFTSKGLYNKRHTREQLPRLMEKHRSSPVQVSNFTKVATLGSTIPRDNSEYVQATQGVQGLISEKELMDRMNNNQQQSQQQIQQKEDIFLRLQQLKAQGQVNDEYKRQFEEEAIKAYGSLEAFNRDEKNYELAQKGIQLANNFGKGTYPPNSLEARIGATMTVVDEQFNNAFNSPIFDVNKKKYVKFGEVLFPKLVELGRDGKLNNKDMADKLEEFLNTDNFKLNNYSNEQVWKKFQTSNGALNLKELVQLFQAVINSNAKVDMTFIPTILEEIKKIGEKSNDK